MAKEVEQKAVLEAAIDTYMKFLPEMLKEHEGEFVIIRDEDKEPSGEFWHCEQDAIKVAYENFGNIPFLVREVSKEYEIYGRSGKPITITRNLK